MDLAGFKTMTDALGGVDVCVRASPHVETGVDDTGRPYRATNLDDPFSGSAPRLAPSTASETWRWRLSGNGTASPTVT